MAEAMDGAQTLQLPAQATLDEASALLREFKRAVRGGQGPLRVDGSALKRYDTSVLALLLELRRRAQAAGRGFEAIGLPQGLTTLAGLYGVLPLLSSASSSDSPGRPAA